MKSNSKKQDPKAQPGKMKEMPQQAPPTEKKKSAYRTSKESLEQDA